MRERDEARAENERLHTRIARLEAALRFYADKRTWVRPWVKDSLGGHNDYSPADLDEGKRARQALEDE